MREEIIKNRFQKENIELSDEQVLQFVKYYELLVEWNEKINLTAITEFEEVVEKHFVDSVLGEKFIDFSSPVKLIDVGTGAGFPAIPLKIVHPEIEVLLLDSLQKRIKFLDIVINELGLKGITAMHGRAEEVARNSAYREQYNYAVSRAVARLSSLCEFCIPFVKVGGSFIAYKSQKAEEELAEAKNAIEKLSAGGAKIHTITLGDDMNRSFITIKKVKPTDAKYPRGGGKPLNKPL